MDRRKFLKSAAASATLLNCFPSTFSSLERIKETNKLERRTLGKTGEKLSILGLGGVVVMNATAEQASQRVEEAIDHGINYFDVAPSYGNAEDMMGPALEPYRKNVFLACKTTERTKAGAAAELDRSPRKCARTILISTSYMPLPSSKKSKPSSNQMGRFRLSWTVERAARYDSSVFPLTL